MNTRYLSTCLAIMLLFASAGHAGQALMDFEYTYSPIGTSYADLGVSFDGNEAVYTGGVSNLPSGVNYIEFPTASSTTCNVTGGFTGISLHYCNGAATAGTLTVYSGANATGSVLATVSLPKNITTAFNTWTLKTASHATALSFRLSGTADSILFDDIRLTGTFKPHAFYVPAASNVGRTSATLSTTMNPSGDSTSVVFALSTDGGTTWPIVSSSQNIGSGTANVAVSQPITGLVPGTQYTFVAEATNSAGFSQSWTNTFTTLQTTATTLPATSITGSSAVLNASVNPAGDATSVFFQYATNSSLTGATSTTAQNIGSGTADVAVNAALTGLAPGLYYYRVVATNAGGTFNGSISSVSLNPGYTVNGAATGTFTDISGTGTQVFGASVDDSASSVNLGFPFEFFGTAYTSLAVSSNGLVAFGGSLSTATNIDFAAASPSTNVDAIAVLWDDWVTGTAGRVYTQTTGTAGQRVFTVQWNQMSGYGSAGTNPATFQLQLFEATSDILIIAQDTTTEVTGSNDGATNGGGASVGIRKAGAPANGNFLMYSHNSATITSGTKIRYSPLKPVVGLLAASGLSYTTATLNGTVNPNASATTAQFQYGMTTSYGSTASVTLSPNNNSAVQNVSANLTGLTRGTLYHYRLSATNALGTNSTSDGTFFVGGGVPDSTFSGDGIQITPIVDGATPRAAYARDVAVQGDGKIVAAGFANNGSNDDVLLARYLTDGTLDPGFGTGGVVRTPAGTALDRAFAVAIQPDGKIVAAGEIFTGTNTDMLVLRYHADGTPDNSFSGDGRQVIPVGPAANAEVALNVALQPDGMIVACGYVYVAASNTYQMLLARLESDGDPDPTFDGDGVRQLAVGTIEDICDDLAIQPDGKIVGAGAKLVSAGVSDTALVRLLPNGALDPTFGSGGIVTTDISGNDRVRAVELLPDGRIAVGGLGDVAGNSNFTAARYLANGQPDTSFDGDGKISIPIGIGNEDCRDMVLQPDGKLVLVGITNNGTNDDMAVIRLTMSGALDSSFDGDGIVTIAPGPGMDRLFGVALESGGGIVAAGHSASAGGVAQVALVRLLGDSRAGVWSLAAAQGAGGGNLGITGQIDPAGLSTTVSIEYGTTMGLGSTQPVGTFSGSTLQNFSTTLYPGGLTWGTTYYYRTVATNANGTTTTAIQTLIYAPGGRDFSFGGGDGILSTPIGSGDESGQGVALQPDGKAVVVGYTINGSNYDLLVARYNTDGTLDTTFGGGDGIATVDFAGQYDAGYSVALQSDGKIVVAGETGSPAVFAVARLHGDAATGTPGTLDTSFDGDGKVTTTLGLNDVPATVVIQPDGKIVVGGYSYNGSNADFALVRYNSNGSLDTAGFGATGTTFTGTGKVTTAIGSGDDYGNLALLPNGKIVMAGRSVVSGINQFSVARYNSNGTLDTSFDGDGKTTTAIGIWDDGGSKVLCQPDGKIVLGGYSQNGSNYDFAMVRYLSTGALDGTFGSGGKVTAGIGSGNDLGRNIALQSDGRLVLVGDVHNGSNNDFGVARFNPDGTLDTTFDGDGKVTLAIGSGDDVVRGLALQSDGGIVVAGRTHNGTNLDIAVARLLAGERPLLVNGGFEANESLGGGQATGFADWKRDQASTVATENGITPYAGTRMLKFLGTSDVGASSATDSDVAQYVDLSPYAAQIALGNVSVEVKARFNRVAGSGSTDTSFGTFLIARSGTIEGGTGLASNTAMLTSDGNTSTWEEVTNTLTLPVGTTNFFVNLIASEDMVNDSVAPEFAGHYADDVTLTLTVRSDIQVEQPVGTILVDGTSTVDFGTTPLGTPVTRTFRITNTGGETLNVTGITLPGGYEHVGPFAPVTVAPNATHTFDVRFLANTVAGNFNGTMTLASDDTDAEGSFAVGLTGRAARVYPGAMAIKTANPAAPDGIYTLDPDGVGGAPPFNAYCDMTQFGGGWTLLLKADGTQPTFQYNSALWTNTTTLNPGSPGLDGTEFKSPGFSTVPFNAIMVGVQTAGITRYLQPGFTTPLAESSLRAMFSSAEKLSTNSRANWLGLTSPASAFDSHVAGVRGGVNITAPANYPSIRLGVLLNNEADNLTPDAFVGMGAGPWLGQLVTTSGAANYIHGYHAPGVGFLFVRDTTAGAVPSYAPTVVSQNATDITTTTATLNGTVNPNGIITSAWFEWGETTSYGITTGAEAVGYGTSVVAKAETITGLIPGRTIHYRLVAQTGETTTYGADMTFTTFTHQQGWRQQYFGTTSNAGNAADSFDFDNDGLANLLEWALGLNPTTAGSLPAITTRNGAVFEFTYPRSAAAVNAGTVFTVEWSDALPGTTWSSSGVTEQILSDNGTVQQVKATLPAGSSGRRFVHLKVTSPP